MSVTLEEARKIVLDTMPKGSVIKSAITYEGKYLFIAHWPDPLEGHLDPFFSVDPDTEEFRDFNPGYYDEPRKVIDALNAALEE